MVWYFYLLKKFPQFVVIHIVNSFDIVSNAEVDDFLEFFFFFNDPTYVGNLISGFLCLFYIQLEHLEVLGSCTAEAWLEEF